MSKQELLLIVIIILACIRAATQPFIGVAFFYYYFGLYFNRIFVDLRVVSPLVIVPAVSLVSLIFGGKKLRFPPQLILLGVFFVWMCLSRLFNGYSVLDGEEIEPFFNLLFFLFLLVNTVDSKKKLIVFLWVMVMAYTTNAFVARYFDRFVPYYFLNRNNFSISLVGAIAIPALFALYRKGVVHKCESICYFVILLYGIAGSNSRGGYLGLGVILGLLILLQLKKPVRLALILAPIVFVLINISTMHWERLGTVSVDTDQGGTGGQRIALWTSGARMTVLNPVFGVGSGESGPMFPSYATLEEQFRVGGHIGEESIKIHNMTLQVSAEMGFVGLLLFFSILFMSYKDIWRAMLLCRSNDQLSDQIYLPFCLLFSITGMLISGQFGNYAYNYQFYTLISLCACLNPILANDLEVNGGENESERDVMGKMEIPVRTMIFFIFTYLALK